MSKMERDERVWTIVNTNNGFRQRESIDGPITQKVRVVPESELQRVQAAAREYISEDTCTCISVPDFLNGGFDLDMCARCATMEEIK